MIPVLKTHIGLNTWALDRAVDWLQKNYLPTFEIVETSKYRSPQHNRDVGGAPDSAHIYGLALDFALKNKTTGNILSDEQLKNVWSKFVKPYWPGYTYYSPKQKDSSTGWIHVNLDRSVSKSMFPLALAVTVGGLGFLGYKTYKLLKNRKA